MNDIHILAVDDEEELLQTISVILELQGYTIHRSTSPSQALSMITHPEADADPVDILLTDIEMPEFSGISLIERVHGSCPDLPVLAMTGYGTKKMVVELLHKGIADYIDKPFKMDDLVGRVGKLAEKVRHRRKDREQTEQKLQERETHIHALEEKMLASQEFELLGKLARGVAHDFNNLLVSIVGYADMVRDMCESPGDTLNKEQVHGFVRLILKAAGTAQVTVGQLRGFTKGEKHRHVELDVHEVLRYAIKMCSATLRPAVRFNSTFDARDRHVMGEPSLLSNAFINLFFNARDSMPDGGKVTVLTSCVHLEGTESSELDGGKYLLISISDEGEGIPPEIQQRIFEPFFTTKGDRGNGLGLPSVLNTISSHKGMIRVHSTPSEGTTFKLYLPVIDLGG